MFANPTDTIRLSTQLLYGANGVSGAAKFLWRKFLTELFESELATTQIHYHESRAAGKLLSKEVLDNHRETRKLAEAIALIECFSKLVRRKGDILSAENLDSHVQLCRGELSLTKQENKQIEDLIQDVTNEYTRLISRTRLKVPYDLRPLYLDLLLRFGTLTFYNLYWSEQDKDVFMTICNLLFIPAITFLVGYLISRRSLRVESQLLEKHGETDNFLLEPHLSSSQYTLLGAFAFLMVLSSIGFGEPIMPSVLGVLPLTILYYALFLRVAGSIRLDENQVIKRINHPRKFGSIMDHDENDKAIVELESRLNATTTRLEAYVLESALLGALSFSGFLQIMAENLVSIRDLQNFTSSLMEMFSSALLFDWLELNQALDLFDSETNVFSLISIETLLCSFFFLTVIGTRLRFSDVADKVRERLNLAKSYNLKEEFIVEHEKKLGSDRFLKYNRQIHEQLEDGEKIFEQVLPIMGYMRYFRNAGILMFLVILISSSLFISTLLSWVFITLALATVVYFNKVFLTQLLQSVYLQLSVRIFGRAYWILSIGISLILFGYVSRIWLEWQMTGLFIVLGFAVLSLFIYVTLVLMPTFDEHFVSKVPDSRLKRLKTVWGFGLLLYLIGTAFISFHLPGGAAFTIVAMLIIASSSFSIGSTFTESRMLGLLTSLAITIGTIGITFKTLVMVGSTLLMSISIVLFSILVVLAMLVRNRFHKLLINTFVAYFIVLTYCLTDSSRILRTAYDHYTSDQRTLNSILEAHDAAAALEANLNKPELLPGLLASSIQLSESYISQYEDRFEEARAYRHLKDFHYGVAHYHLTSDIKSGFDLSLLAVRHAERLDQRTNFRYLHKSHAFLQVDLLEVMDRMSDAAAYLNRLGDSEASAEIKELAKERLLELEKGTP